MEPEQSPPRLPNLPSVAGIPHWSRCHLDNLTFLKARLSSRSPQAIAAAALDASVAPQHNPSRE